MKKVISVLAASALCLTMGAGVGSNLFAASAAEDVSHIKTAQTSVCGLKPYAWYQFEDEDNLGKDTMGNFDLTMKVSGSGVYAQKKKSEGDNYVELRRKAYDEDYEYTLEKEASADNGVLFYAPFVKDGLDMSDLITGSYTVSITFRSPTINANLGSYYMFSTGRYIDAPSMVCWGKGIRVQTGSKLGVFGASAEQNTIDNDTTNVRVRPENPSEDTWYNITMVGDAENNVVKLYLDGVLVESVQLQGVAFSNQGKMDLGSDYVFALGGQSAGTGAQTCHADIDISDCKVFDYALSAENVSALNKGEETSYSGIYVESVPELDVSAIDFQLTDVNPMSELLNNLPDKATVTLSDGSKNKASIAWINKGNGKCFGVLQSSEANLNAFHYEYDCEYVVKFAYNSEHVTISDIKVGSDSMNPDEVLKVDGSKSMSMSFKLEVKGDCGIDGVWYDDTNEFIEDAWSGDDEGYIYLRIREGAVVTIVSHAADNTPDTPVTPDDEPKNDTTGNKKKGCGSVMIGAFVPVALLAAAFACKKERE